MDRAGCTDCGRGYEADPFHLDCGGDSAPWDALVTEGEFRLWARASGQVLCMESDTHVEWWIDETHGCPWCKAVV